MPVSAALRRTVPSGVLRRTGPSVVPRRREVPAAPILKQRTIVGRAAPPSDTSTPLADAKTPATTTTLAATATAAAADDGLVPDIVPGVLSSVLGEPTTCTSSSTATPSVLATTSPKLSTPAASHVVVHTKGAQKSGGMSVVTVIGDITVTRAIVAFIFSIVTIAIFIRRWRKRRSAEDPFSASQLRQSATFFDEKDDNAYSYLRPTVTKRRNVSSPSAAGYLYSDQRQSFPQHRANQIQYRAVSTPQHPSVAAGNHSQGYPLSQQPLYREASLANPFSVSNKQGPTKGSVPDSPSDPVSNSTIS